MVDNGLVEEGSFSSFNEFDGRSYDPYDLQLMSQFDWESPQPGDCPYPLMEPPGAPKDQQ